MSVTLNAMSMKLKMVLVIVLTVVIAAGWFLISYHPTQKTLAKVRTQVTAEQQQVAALQAQLSHLQALKANEPKLRALIARYNTALPADPKLPQFILQIQDSANKAGVDFLSVAPALPSAPSSAAGTPTTNVATGLREIAVSINTTGKYFTLENFMYRLEHLGRVLRVDTFSVTPGGTSSGGAASGGGSMSIALKLRMFMSPTPAAPAAAPTTTKAGA